MRAEAGGGCLMTAASRVGGRKPGCRRVSRGSSGCGRGAALSGSWAWSGGRAGTARAVKDSLQSADGSARPVSAVRVLVSSPVLLGGLRRRETFSIQFPSDQLRLLADSQLPAGAPLGAGRSENKTQRAAGGLPRAQAGQVQSWECGSCAGGSWAGAGRLGGGGRRGVGGTGQAQPAAAGWGGGATGQRGGGGRLRLRLPSIRRE